MKNFFKNKSLAFYLVCLAFVIGLANTVIYACYSLNVNGKFGNHFNSLIFVLLLLGTVACILPILKPNWKFTIIIPSALFSAAFGYYINDRLIMFEEMINKIYGMMESGAVLPMVILILVLDVVCIILTIVASFLEFEKKNKKLEEAK